MRVGVNAYESGTVYQIVPGRVADYKVEMTEEEMEECQKATVNYHKWQSLIAMRLGKLHTDQTLD